MALPTGLNGLAKFTLLASDASYFKTDLVGSWLAALPDTTYGIAPKYSVSQEYKAIDQWVDSTTGFGVIVYKKDGATPAETEIIIALRGTDGPNPQDWVANSQYLGWNQWNSPNGRARVFNLIDSLRSDPSIPGTAFEGEIHFTGQSLGGGLAQYAAYEYVQSHQGLTGFSKANITLTTFNGFGGVLQLQQNVAGGYQASVLANIGSNAHFYTEGDLVSRLGSLNGVGHTGGTTYMLNAHASKIDPDTGEPFLLNAIDAHRIETGFYPFLLPGVEFEAAVARPIEYLPMQNVQRLAALYGRVLNDQDISPLESLPRLVAGLIAGLSLGNPTETNALAQAVLTNLHSAGQMSDVWYVTLRKYDWGAIAQNTALVAPGATSAAYGLSLLAAMLSDALEFQVDRHVQLFDTIREWVSSAVPTVAQGISSEDRRVQAEMLLALVPGAAIGSKLIPLLQPLALDLNEWAQTLITAGPNWLHDGLVAIRDHSNALGQNLATLSADLASTVVEVAFSVGASPTTVQTYLNNVLVPFIRDTAQGYVNAATEFLQDVAGAFDLGRGLNFSELHLIDQAYAAELSDPRLSSSVKTAIEDAREIVQQAGQTVVVQQGIGVNPFTTPGFIPDTAPLATGTVREDGANVFTVYLPYAAGTGGQGIRLTLNSLGSNSVTVLSNGQELTPQNGGVTLVVPEGQQQLFFTLRAPDVSSNTVLSLAAVLVNSAGTPTHVEHPEATVSLVDHAIEYDNGRPVVDISSSIPGLGSWVPELDEAHNYLYRAPDGVSTIALVSGNDQIYGSPGFNFITAGNGHDRIYGGDGNDALMGGNYFLVQQHYVLPFEEADGNDVVDGQGGDDTIEGDGNDDHLYGSEGSDRLFGDAGPLVYGSYGSPPGGDDLVDGGADHDFLWGDYGADILLGGTGDDVLVGDYVAHHLVTTAPPYLTPVVFDRTRAKDDFLDGGDGADILFGDGGNDMLAGGAGEDMLFGDYGAGMFVAAGQFNPADGDLTNVGGNDVLDGGADNDFLYGMGGDDVISGGEGVDVLFGDFDTSIWTTATVFGNDVIDAGGGNDDIIGGSGQDSLFGGTGDDRLWGDDFQVLTATGDDVLDGGEGADVLFGGRGNDRLVGGEGHDILLGTSDLDWNSADHDVLTGGAGDDRMYGMGGDDVLNGGEGKDVLFGDDYHVDQLFPGPIAIQPGLLLQNLVSSTAPGNDVLDGGANDDFLAGGAGNDILFGGSGNDFLYGDSGQFSVGGDDRLAGGLGNDVLDGGGGNDIYEFNVGDGRDDVSDSGQSNDTILFGSGISSSSVTLTPDSGRIFVKVGAGSDGVLLGNIGDVFASQTIEQFQFADGTTLTYADLIARGFDLSGTASNDVLFGTNLTNRFIGGLGNDTFFGGLSEDTYFFNSGDGIDLIADSSTPDGSNTVIFGSGITAAQVTLGIADDLDSGQANVLVVRPDNGTDAIHLKDLDRTNVFGPHAVDSFQFADGTRLSYEHLLSRGFDLVGTADNDMVLGTNITDRIMAGAGDDEVRAGAGDDLVDGGAGDDQLRGESGNDTYMFGSGSGHDEILDEQGMADVVRLAPGIVSSDVALTRSGDNLVLNLNGGADQLTVAHHFLLPMFRIEEIQFSDGSVLTSAFLDSPVIQGTEQSDVLGGTGGDDVLIGLGDDDQIAGLAGHDVLDGGTGADQLTGGAGDDTYVIGESGDVVIEALGEGIDTIQSSITSTLGMNLEHLTLIGAAAVNGIGNEMDNRLTGNSAANVLSGGAGNDTYVASVGDTVVELAGEGTDTVQSGGSATLGAHVENLTLTGSASLTGTGNALDNILQAAGSISVLAGGDGNDTYVLGPNGGDDILVETATGGIDTVIAAQDYRLPANIENLTMLDPLIPDFANFSLIPYGSVDVSVSGYGNDRDNVLTGGRSRNVLDGGLGVDTLIGGAGDDTYVVDHLNDVVIEQANEGADTIHSSANYILSEHVENLTLTGVASVSGTGNALNNDVRGNEAPNVLDGKAGDDSLQGFGGADTYLFSRGAGSDIVFDFSAAGEVETIQLASDVAPADIEVYRREFSLVLVITGTTDELTLASFFDQPAYAQKQVRFADSTVWNEAELRTRAMDGGPIIGTTGNDTLSGGAGHRVLIGNAGNDILTGGDWNDVLYGDATFQSLFGPQVIGDDTLTGGAGDDLLIDFRGTNLFDGGTGNDTLNLGRGVDTVLFGRGSGIDAVTLDNNRADIDIIQMAAGISPADVVMTRRSSPLNNIVDLLISDSGDTLTVALSTDWFAVGPETTQAVIRFTDGTQWGLTWAAPTPSFATGTSVDDVVSGIPGEVLRGLAGNDTYSVGAWSGPVIELPSEGTDTVQSTVDYTLPANVENLILQGNFTSVGPYADNATGNELDNLIVGNTRDNVLDGGAGNDVLVGGIFRELEGPPYVEGTGSDILIGGQGDDVLMADGGNFSFIGGLLFLDGGLDFQEHVPRQADDLFIGGTGNDTYILHSQQQTVAEFANEGTDTVRSTVDYVLGDHVENLTLLENVVMFLPGPLLGTGNGLDNVLIGNSEDNVLSGEIGNDTLWGGSGIYRDSDAIRSGSDRLIGGTGHDTYLFNVGDGIDTIQDASVVGAGNRIQFGTGISQSDLTFTHDEAARTLTIQVGSSGTDQLLLTNFDPTGANGSLVVDTLAFADGSTASLALLLGFGGPVATNGDDTITTGSGDDVVDALGGNDTITGGAGNDQLTGGTGNDTYIFNVGDGVDTITDTAIAGEGNTVEFGTGLTSTDLTLDLGSLLIRVGTNGDAIHLTSFEPNDALGAHAIETFRFADGTTVSYSQLLARGFDLTGTADNDDITGTNVVDRINGLAGNDTLQSGAGDDVLDGGTGADTMTGGTGNDTYDVDNVGDVVIEQLNEGTDTVQSSVSNVLGANVENLTLMGTNAIDGTGNLLNNVLTGNSGDNVLDGAAGADQLVGGVGNDTYMVDYVGDVVTEQANEGTDTVQSSISYVLGVNVENLTLTGTANLNGAGNVLDNVLTGNSGNNILDGGTGADTLIGGQGSDTYIVDNAGNVVTENLNEGIDLVQSSVTHTLGANLENLTLTGTAAITGTGNSLDNMLTGNSAANTLTGGGGNDTLNGGAGVDTLVGGTGNDTYVVDAAGNVVAELANEGTDTVQSSLTYTLGANVENLTLTGTAAINGTGNALDNILTGNSAANTLTGGAGNDTYIVSIGDTVVEQATHGLDTVQSDVTWTLGVNLEALTLTGTANINGTGNALDNVLTGNSGANVLTGGAGNDVYVIGAGDTVVEGSTSGTDTILSDVTQTLAANVEMLVLTGTSAINGTGNSLNNVLTGNATANVLNGGAGADTLAGLDGHDTYLVDNTGDAIIELANNGTDLVHSSVTYTLAANVEHLTLTGTTAINGTGNILDNVLIGNSANNTLTGGAGNDTLDGEAGNDTLRGGTGNDTYVVTATGDMVTENANEGTDTVQSSLTYTLGANVENLTLTGTATINGTGNTANNILTGNSAANTLSGANGADTLRGGQGNDTVNGGSGNDTFQFGRGEGQDLVQDNSGSADKLLYDAGINPLDLVISRQTNDLRLSIHGSIDQVTVQNWYTSSSNRTETIQAGNGQTLLSTQVDQLIQAMAGFTQQTGLTWDQGIDQQPQQVQTVLAASWQ